MSADSSTAAAAPQVSTPSVPRGAKVDLAGVSHSYPLSHDLEHGWLHLLLRRFSPAARARYEAEAAKPDQLAVLNDIDLTVAPGEFVSLVGPSGCGKSTILRLLAGLEQPVKGSVTVDSTQVTGPSPLRALAFQDATLLPWRTVRDNVALGPEARGRMERDRRRVEAALQISTTIRMAAFTRRREIGIMRLVGASNFYILLPFLLESLIAGLIGVLISSGSIAITYLLLIEQTARPSIPAIAWIGADHVFNAIICIAVVGVALSVIPTLLATRKYLRI